MTPDDTMKLFMPIVISSLTSAVYSCQLLKPNLNPEQAIADILLTQHRLSEVLLGQRQKSADRDLRLGQILDAEVQQLLEKKSQLSAMPQDDARVQATRILLAQIELLNKISEFLRKDQEQYGYG